MGRESFSINHLETRVFAICPVLLEVAESFFLNQTQVTQSPDIEGCKMPHE